MINWDVVIWTHDGEIKKVTSDGSETFDELIKKAGLNAQEVNGMEAYPHEDTTHATQERGK